MKLKQFTSEAGTDNKFSAEMRFGDKRDLSKMFGLSTRTVSELMTQGMPFLKFGKRRVRFDLPECRQWFVERFGQRCIK